MKTKRPASILFFKTILILSLSVVQYSSQAQLNPRWSKTFGGPSADRATDIGYDHLDNAYGIGNFKDQMIIDGQTIAMTGDNSFIIKIDSQGTKKWAIGIPGSLQKVSVDPNNSNNIVVAGVFTGSVLIGTTNLMSNGSTDCYAVLVDSTGVIQWATSWGGNAGDGINDLEFQLDGNVFVVGNFKSDILFFSNNIFLNRRSDTVNNINTYSAKLRETNSNTIWVSASYVGGSPGSKFILDADMRGNIGLSIGTYPSPYFFYRLDSNLNSVEQVGVASTYNSGGVTYYALGGNSRLDKFSNLYFDYCHYYNRFTPPGVGPAEDEYLSVRNIYTGAIFPTQHRSCIVCNYGPFWSGIGIHGNRIVINSSLNNNNYVTNYVWAVNYGTGYAMGTNLPNAAGNKLFAAGMVSNTDAVLRMYELPAQPLKADAGLDQHNCGNGVYLGGYPSLSGGQKGPYQYSWSPATGLSNPNIPYPLANPAVNITYVLTVTDGLGSTATDVVNISTGPLPPPIISAGGPTTFCQGNSVVLTAPAGFNYLWSTGATTRSITINSTGNYSVTVTTANGCSSISAPTSVTVNPLPNTPAVTSGGLTSFCQGGSVTLTAPAGFNYLWTTGATTQSIVVNTAGNYSVTVTNGNGCSSTSAGTSVTVNQLPLTPLISASGPTTFCQGGSVILTAPAGFTYLWSTGATSQSIPVSTSGNYAVTVTNANNCSATSTTSSVTVNSLPAIPVISASGPTTFCQGGFVTLSAPAGFSYLWNTGATTQSINVNTSGNYSVTITNANGCSASSLASTVTVNTLPPVPLITASGPTTFCQGGSVTLTTPAGFAYLWSTGSTSQSINVNTSGSYSVTVTNANGCSSTSAATTVTVNAFPAIPTISASGPTTFCQGGSVTLTAPAGFSYLWSNAATTQSINVTASGNYSVTVTNANNCSAVSATTTVTINSLPAFPTITASGPTTFCQGGSVTLTAPAGFTYLWSTGATSQTINVTITGNFNVRVTNANNCSATSANTAVTINGLPAIPTITQNGNTLTSSPATTYQWYYNGVIIAGAMAQSYSYSTGGDFTVEVTNAAGCSATSAVYTAMRREIVTIGTNERFSFNLFPNPVNTQLQITYQIEQTHNVAISLINTNGLRIPIQNPVQRSAGSYSVNANAVAERIWTGVYILEFTIDGQRVTRTIVKF